ncbi:hypothetical protein TNCV_2980421 [Trichonephila clavipes]|nr:hypothetical protein TNCV_2980421 [Trichonephila clavipes]
MPWRRIKVRIPVCLPYPSMAIIPPQTEMRFIREQNPMLFVGSSTMTMTPLQVSSPVLNGELYPCYCTCARNYISCNLSRMVWVDSYLLLLEATGFICHMPWIKGLE